MSVPSLALTRGEVRALMGPAEYLSAVELAFRTLAEDRAHAPPPLALELENGGFHGKAAALVLDEHTCVALKFNGNFPDNPSTHNLPTIQGTILLCDGETGSLLAVMDSIEVTARRTAAATALAAKHLARSESETVLICGCGQQAAAQLDALRGVMKIKRGYCWDGEDSRAAAFAQEHGFTQVDDLPTAALASDVIVTCTTSTEPFLAAEMAKPGSFIAAVGADAPHKSEIEPSLMARARVVTDLTKQCTVMGDLHHAIEGGAMCAEDVHAELGEIVVRAKSGRTRGDEIIVFDSTGVAVQDVASAVEIYRRALAAGARTRIALGV